MAVTAPGLTAPTNWGPGRGFRYNALPAGKDLNAAGVNRDIIRSAHAGPVALPTTATDLLQQAIKIGDAGCCPI